MKDRVSRAYVVMIALCLVPHPAASQTSPPQVMTFAMMQELRSGADPLARGLFGGFISGSVQALAYTNKDLAECQPQISDVLGEITNLGPDEETLLADTPAVQVIESIMYSLCAEN